MNTFSIGDMVRFGWETFKKRPWFFIGVQVLILVVSSIGSQLSGYVETAREPGMLMLALVGVFVGIVIQILVKMGTINFALKAHDAPEAANLNDLWAPRYFLRYFLASLTVGVIVVFGIILLIVPGIIWALRYMFVPYLVIDRGLGVMDALRESSRITNGHKWQLLLFVIVLGLVNLLGILALIVGLLVTMPITMFAIVHAYRILEHSASEVAAAPAA